MSILIWTPIGMALWHFTVSFPDKFVGGIIGALLVALGGALFTGYMLPDPGAPLENPPGIEQALWSIPGTSIALAVSYWWGARRHTLEAHDAS